MFTKSWNKKRSKANLKLEGAVKAGGDGTAAVGAASESVPTVSKVKVLVKDRSVRDFSSCTLCDLFFVNARALEVHYVKCIKERSKEWDREQQKAIAAASQVNLLMGTGAASSAAGSDIERLHCVLCDRYFSSEAVLKNHREDIHPEGPGPNVYCPVCEQACDVPLHITQAAQHRRSSTLKLQRTIEDDVWPRPCLECDLSFETREAELKHGRQMRRHCRIMHERQAETAADEWHRLCWPCDRYFASEVDFSEHQHLCPSPLSFMTRLEGEILLAFSAEGSTLPRRATTRTLHSGGQQRPSRTEPLPSIENSSSSRLRDAAQSNPSSERATSVATDLDCHEGSPPNDEEAELNPFESTTPLNDLAEGQSSANLPEVSEPPSSDHDQEMELERRQTRPRYDVPTTERAAQESEASLSSSPRRPMRPAPSPPVVRPHTMHSTEPPTSPVNFSRGDMDAPRARHRINQRSDASEMLASVMRERGTSDSLPERPHTVYSTAPPTKPPTPSSASFQANDRAAPYRPAYLHHSEAALPNPYMRTMTAPAVLLDRSDTLYSTLPEPPTSPLSNRGSADTSPSRPSFSPQGIPLRPPPSPTKRVPVSPAFASPERSSTAYPSNPELRSPPPLPPKIPRSSTESAQSGWPHGSRRGSPQPLAFVAQVVDGPVSPSSPTASASPARRDRQSTYRAPPVPPRPPRTFRPRPPPPVPTRSAPVLSSAVQRSSGEGTSEDDSRERTADDDSDHVLLSTLLTASRRQLASPSAATPGSRSDPLPRLRLTDADQPRSSPTSRVAMQVPLDSPLEDELPPPSYNDAVAQDSSTQSVDVEEGVSDLSAEPSIGTSPSFLRVRSAPSLPTHARHTRTLSLVSHTPAYECPLCLEEQTELANLPCGHVFCNPCIKHALNAESRCPLCRATANVADIRKVFL